MADFSRANFTMTRRRFVEGALGVGAGALVNARTSRAAPKEMVWSTWDANAKRGYITPFEQSSGIKIREAFLSNEDAQFAAMKTGAAGDWDIVNPSINGIRRYVDSNLFMPLETSKIPNLTSMYPAFANNERVRGGGKLMAVPYLWGLNPIVYRADKLSGEPDYGTLFDSKYKGQLAMRDYALEGVAIGGLYAGVSRDRVFTMDDKELAEAKKALIAQKPLLRTYWQNIGDLTNLFATGEVDCAFSWRVPFDVLKDKFKMGMAKPKAGVMGWCDCASLPAGLAADKVDAGHAFINYLLGAEYASLIAEGGNYATTSGIIRDKLSQEKRIAIFVDDLSVTDALLWPVAPPNYAMWQKIWADVKAS